MQGLQTSEEVMMKFRNHNQDRHMSKQGLILFYQELLKKGTLVIGGAGHRRLLQLQGVKMGEDGKVASSLNDAVSTYLRHKK